MVVHYSLRKVEEVTGLKFHDLKRMIVGRKVQKKVKGDQLVTEKQLEHFDFPDSLNMESVRAVCAVDGEKKVEDKPAVLGSVLPTPMIAKVVMTPLNKSLLLAMVHSGRIIHVLVRDNTVFVRGMAIYVLAHEAHPGLFRLANQPPKVRGDRTYEERLRLFRESHKL